MAQENLGRDLKLDLVDNRWLSIYRPAETQKRVSEGGRGVRIGDFETVDGRTNLGQALKTRLLTPQGELASLGHPDYGSRLHEVIGQPNTETTRNLAKLHVLASLKAERRVDEVLLVDVAPHRENRFLIEIAIAVRPVGAKAELAISFALEL